MEKKDISGKVRVNNASFKGAVNASSVDFKSSIVNNDNINACVAERGVAGFSPTANVVKSGDDVTITITDYRGTTTATIPDMSSEVERIESLIPHTASPTNKLIDTATLNSSVQTATSNFRGDWATYADIPADASLYPVDAAGVRTPSTNDYLVVVADEEQNGGTWRYKYVGLWSVDGKNGWQAEYQVNETPFTAEQLAAINSGITSELVEEIGSGGGGGLEIGDIGIAPLGIDETKGKRRYLNGQLIIQDQYVQFTNKVKSAVALYPSLACTESEWQTTATMTVGGQVGKFVVDDEAGTIRLPKIIMPIQGLTDLSKLGEIVEAGLPNITGKLGGDSANGVYGLPNLTGAFKNIVRTYNNIGLPNGGACISSFEFDASCSNPIYSKSNTVQQEQVQYPYFIQVATGAETEDNIINEIELNNPYSLGDSKYSPVALNNLSWLKSEGQWNSKAVYPSYYEWLLKIYNGVEVVEGVSVKLTTEEYTNYDFVLNTADETFRLPLLDGSERLPDYSEQIALTYTTTNTKFLVNGVAYFGYRGASNTSARVYINDKEFGLNGSSASNISGQTAYIVSRNDVYRYETASNGQYGTLYPFKGNGSLYFYVGETVQNANLINAGRIEEKLASLISDNSNLIASYATLDISKRYQTTERVITILKPSYVSFYGQIGAYQLAQINVNGVYVTSMTNPTNAAVYIGGASLLADKGDVITLGNGFTSATITTTIIPLKGVEE